MAELNSKFNSGELTSNTIDRQFTPEYVTKAVVTLPKRKKVFSKHSNRISMPKHHGDKLSREIDFGMIDQRNMQDGNVDANTATIIQDVWYHTNASETVIATFDSKNFLRENGNDQDAARAAAKAAAVTAVANGAATDKLMSSSGGIVNGAASYAATEGPLVPMPEEGGVINLLNHSSKLVSCNLTFHGTGHKFSMRSVDLDSRKGLIARKIKHLGDAVENFKEMQVRRDLLAAGSANAMICVGPTNASTIGIDEIDGTDVLTYEALEAFEQELLINDVPMETELLTGVDLVDTKTISDGWILYVNNEILPTLRKMTGPGGSLVWTPVNQYGAGTEILDGEKGAIGSFRFVVVKDLERQYGAGEVVGGADDAADAATQAAAYKTVQSDGTTYNYDVFTALLVGDDSFSIAGFGSNMTKARYLAPKEDVYNDMHAQMAGVSANWSYGFLNYRPERIRTLAFSASR